jgi:replication initiation protein RepC
MKPSGWRKMTPGLCRANELAKVGEQLSISKNQAMLALRRVAPAISLKPGDLLLLDILVVFTKSCDWEHGGRPIVWPSNELLVENTGFSLSAIKRHLRQLAELGLITFKDSSNGKRWGYRDENGRIVEAYGFDLSPLAARAEEFEKLYLSIREKRDLIKRQKRKITILRRIIRAILESEHSVGNIWMSIRSTYEMLVTSLLQARGSAEKLEGICKAFSDLKNKAENALLSHEPERYQDSVNCNETEISDKMDRRDINFEPHIQPTTHPIFVKGKGNEKNAGAAENFVEEVRVECDLKEKIDARGPRISPIVVSIQSILYACPAFAEMASGLCGQVRNWRDFVAVADRMRPMIGISADAWSEAKTSMSPEEAATAIALITDKYSEGKLTSPGGYLRGLVKKAKDDQLHLERSIFGRVAARQ